MVFITVSGHVLLNGAMVLTMVRFSLGKIFIILLQISIPPPALWNILVKHTLYHHHAFWQRCIYVFFFQLLGQIIGRDLPVSFGCMVDDIKAKLREVHLPYIVPSSYCLPYPGSNITAIFDVDISHPGDKYKEECKCCLSHCGRYLYVAERQKKGGDLLKVFDIASHGLMTKFFGLKGRLVKKFSLAARDT